MHHTVGGHLVGVDDPGAVHCHHLHREETSDWSSGLDKTTDLSCESTNPIGIVVDVELLVAVHGSDTHAVLHVFGQQPVVDHVEVQSVVQFNVHVVDQGGSYVLWRSQHEK